MSICDDAIASMAAWAAGHSEQRDQAVEPDPEEAVVKFYTMSYKVIDRHVRLIGRVLDRA